MSDIFNEDFGAGNESSQSAEPKTAPDAFVVAEDSSAAAGTQEPADSASTAADQGAQGDQDGTQQQPPAPADPAEGEQQQKPGEVSEDDAAKLEQEVDAALKDERTPKWFKNAVNSVYRPKLDSLGAQVERYSALGTPEELVERVGLLDKLGEIRTDPQTRMPVKTTQGFVQAIYEKDPEITQLLMADLAVLPAPDGSGQTVIQALFNEMGIDPNRLNEIQQFAQNGYQTQATGYPPPDPADLQVIPEHLRATFSKLAPEVRDSLMGDLDHIREQNLEAHRYRLETEERRQGEEQARAQQEQQQLQQQQQQFAQQVDTKSEEYFERSGEGVLTTFVESLAKQAGMTPLDSMMIANTMLNSLEPTMAGRKTAEALKAAGVEIDPAIPPAVERLRELSRHAAYYELVQDKASLQTVANQIAETQERITAKGNKLIAKLASMRGKSVADPAARQAAALAAGANDNRHAFRGSPRTDAPPPGANGNMDFSDEAYMSDLRAEGFR